MRIPTFLGALAACSVLTVVAVAQTTTFSNAAAVTSTFPPVGLAGSETAQINVTNLAAVSTSAANTAACTGTISFVNAAGAVIGTAAPFTVTNGATQSLALPFGKTGSNAVRTEVRGVVTLTESKNQCALSTSFETFDTNTGVTHVYLSTGEIGKFGVINLPNSEQH